MLLEIVELLVAVAILIFAIRNKRVYDATVGKMKDTIASKESENDSLLKQIEKDKELLESACKDLETAKKQYEDLESKFTEEIAKTAVEKPEGYVDTDEDNVAFAETVIYSGPNKKKHGKLVCSCCGGSVGGRGKVKYCSWCGSPIVFADDPKTQEFSK